MKHEAYFTDKLGSKHSLVMKFGQFIWPEKLYQKSIKM